MWSVWLPVIFVPMRRLSRLRCVMAATALSLPYFPAYQMLILLVFPVSLAEWTLVELPFLGRKWYAAAALMPLLVIIFSIWPWVAEKISRWRESIS